MRVIVILVARLKLAMAINKIAIISYSFPIIIGIVGCAQPDESKPEKKDPAPMERTDKKVSSGLFSLNELNFMEGTWIDASGNMPGFHESWVPQGDTLIQVIGYFVNGKDTAIMEAIKVKMLHGVLHYIPKVDEQNNGAEVPFELQDGSTLDSIVFANYNHDFPREITYVKKGKDTVDVYLRGVTREGAPQEYVLKLCKR